MLLIDGVRYELWTPPSEDELEQIVNEHAQEIFGENSIYFDRKQRIKSASGIVSIPDGYAIVITPVPNWHVVEIELSSHPPYEHVVPQVDKFINAADYKNTQNEIIQSLYSAIKTDELLRLKIQQIIGRDKEIHEFLTDLISKPPIITIIIEQNTEQLKEALKKYPQKAVVELQTFTREDAKTVHAHFFEPLYKDIITIKNKQTIIKNEDIDSNFIFIRVEQFWTKYKRLRIASEFLEGLSLNHDMSFELETDIGIIQTKIDKWNEICVGIGKWYKAHPELKAGDTVTFRVLEPSKRYRLEIIK